MFMFKQGTRYFFIVVFLALIALPSSSSAGEPEAELPIALPAIDEFIDDGGVFDLGAARRTGFEGAIVQKGYAMLLDQETQAPIFRPQSRFATLENSDGDWSADFGPAGTNAGVVHALGIFEGDLIVAGTFNQIGDNFTHQIARWNGTKWDTLGGGMGGSPVAIFALAVFKGDLIAGGDFVQVFNERENIARWNGTSWDTLGTDFPDGPVLAMAVHIVGQDTSLFVGGTFVKIGATTVNGIAKWDDGNGWTFFGNGAKVGGSPGEVRTLTEFNGALYAGGSFTTLEDSSMSTVTNWGHIGKWNGSVWDNVQDGVDQVIRTSTVLRDSLIIGGDFTKFKNLSGGQVTADRVAALKDNFSVLGNEFSGASDKVRALHVFSSILYAGGDFNMTGGQNLAKWDGTDWVKVSNDSPNTEVLALGSFGPDLIVGGTLTEVGSTFLDGIGIWTGSTWKTFGAGIQYVAGNEVLALTADGSSVFAGGKFTKAGATPVNLIAEWDGTVWKALSTGLRPATNAVTALVARAGIIYAAGAFDSAGTVAASKIAKWSGTTWSNLGSGSTVGDVKVLAVFGDDVIIGGSFTQLAGSSISRIAKWNGSSLSSFGSLSQTVEALVVHDGRLFAGTIGSDSVYKWTGSAWQSIGRTDNSVLALESFDGDLVAGGDFSIVDGVGGLKRVARWNGSTWSAMDKGFDGLVRDLEVYHCDLIATGNFTFDSLGVVPLSAIARWNGTTWVEMAQASNHGLGDIGKALVATGDDLFVGGKFWKPAGKPSVFIAKYNEPLDGFNAINPWTTASGKNTVVLKWESPGPSTTDCAADSFIVKQSTSSIDSETDWNNADEVSTVEGIPNPASPGTEHCATVDNLNSCTTYYFAVRMRDKGGNLNPLGLDTSRKTKCSGGQVLCKIPFQPVVGSIPLHVEFATPEPNPTRGRSTIYYGIPSDRTGQDCSINVYTVSGRRIRQLLHAPAVPGRYAVEWDLTSDSGIKVAGGVYFLQLRVGDERTSRTIVVVR